MKIQKLTNNRLYYSEDEFYRVNIDIVTEFQLKKNMIIDGQTEKKLLIELLLFRAYGFLIKRDYTEKEIRNKLRMEFPKDAPYDELIEKLKAQLIEALNLEEITPEDIDPEAPLFGDDGLGLDSIDALEIILLLDKDYGIKLKNPAEGKQVFYSVKTMADYIREHGKTA